MTCKKHPRFKSLAFFMPFLAGGGAERVILTLAEEFSKRNIKIYLFLAKYKGEYIPQVPSNVKIINLDTTSIYIIWRLSYFLKKINPDVLFSAMDRPNIITICSKIFSNYRGKTIISVHTTITRSCYNIPSLKSLMTLFLIKMLYNKADLIVTVSRGVANDLKNILKTGKKIITIYNPFNIEKIIEKSREPISHSWFKEKKIPIVLSIGRLTKAKNFPLLIKSIGIARKKTPINLMILGEGEDRAKLVKLIKRLKLQENVRMPGFVDNPYKYMKQASVFVLPSLWEGFGNVLVEALATSTPIVSTDCPNGPREILENGKKGTLVPTANPHAMADAILKIIENPKEITSLDIDKFNSEKIAQTYIDSINKLFEGQ